MAIDKENKEAITNMTKGKNTLKKEISELKISSSIMKNSRLELTKVWRCKKRINEFEKNGNYSRLRRKNKQSGTTSCRLNSV